VKNGKEASMAARHFKISDDFLDAIGDAILLLDDFRDMAHQKPRKSGSTRNLASP